MRKTEIRVFRELGSGGKIISDISRVLSLGKPSISKAVNLLEKKNLVKKTRKGKNVSAEMEKNPKCLLFRKLVKEYDPDLMFSGNRERLLPELLSPVRVSEIAERLGISEKETYKMLNGLKSLGLLETEDKKYCIKPGSGLLDYAKMLADEFRQEGVEACSEVVWRKGGEILKKAPNGCDVSGTETAFSAFSGHGIEITPKERHIYQPGRNLSPGEIFVHSLVFAKTMQDRTLSVIFYLKNKEGMDIEKIKNLCEHFDVKDVFFDILAFLDGHETKNRDMFLPTDEFNEKARLYDVRLRKKFGMEKIGEVLSELGRNLKDPFDIYLIGGGNMMMRGLKNATKDLDVIVEKKEDFRKLAGVLRSLGFREKSMTGEYEKMNPSGIMERGAFRIDIFTGLVCNALHLSEDMKKRSESRKTGNFSMHLVSLGDIFLFKSITGREGDLEDCSIISRQPGIKWEKVMEEIETQGRLTKRFFSFSVLDTLEILKERHGIEIPIFRRLDSHCMGIALLMSLRKPKTMKELKEEIDVPEYKIYNTLKRLEKDGKIKVDRNGKLNVYSSGARVKESKSFD
ncbi:MAG: hypothetical protein JW754_02790 [Candidatus Aenigmarchaeota archaeon]|nr:hypothetical protein [Candidatus Aenigmarchaeota archaeon]